MSIRTIIEINHDYLSKLSKSDFDNLILVLKGTRFLHQLNEGGVFEMCNGIRILGQRHHSDKLTLDIQ